MARSPPQWPTQGAVRARKLLGTRRICGRTAPWAGRLLAGRRPPAGPGHGTKVPGPQRVARTVGADGGSPGPVAVGVRRRPRRPRRRHLRGQAPMPEDPRRHRARLQQHQEPRPPPQRTIAMPSSGHCPTSSAFERSGYDRASREVATAQMIATLLFCYRPVSWRLRRSDTRLEEPATARVRLATSACRTASNNPEIRPSHLRSIATRFTATR